MSCTGWVLHEGYRLRIKGRPEKKHLDVPFDKLSEDMQAAYLAQALRIPENLSLLKLELVPRSEVALTDLVDAGQASPG